MNPTIALILFFILALGVSFLCSLLEAIILSVPRGHVESEIQKGRRSGRLLKKLKSHIDRPLSAILTLNTIAHTVGATGVGAMAMEIWNDSLIVGIVSAVVTICILVFSEVIPKTLGAVHSRALAPFAAYTITGMVLALIWIGVVPILERLARLLTPRSARGTISREELHAFAELSHTEGAIHLAESRVIQNLLALRNIRVKDVLTPRPVLFTLQQDQTISEVVANHRPLRFSRIPIFGKDHDDITGVVHRYKLLSTDDEGKGDQPLLTIADELPAIPDTKTVASALEQFIATRRHIFLVVDEYGGTEGIITFEDVIETLLGVEIIDEFDAVKDMRKLARELGQRRHKQYNPESP